MQLVATQFLPPSSGGRVWERSERGSGKPVSFWIIIACLLLTVAWAGLNRWIETTPIPNLKPETSDVALDHDGHLLRAWQVADGRWRLPVTVEQVDRGYIALLIAYEDGRFNHHSGVDLYAMARAAAQGIRYGRVVSGASTLTMQVARLLEEMPTGSIRAKLRQIRLALALERRLSKDEILNLYLTLAPFGGNLEGVRAATLAWFGKEPRRLTPAEAALLVALPQSPEGRRPDRNHEQARFARDRVLERAVGKGVIAAEEAHAARSEEVPDRRRAFPAFASHLTDRMRFVDQSNVVHLTLERDIQIALETLVRDRVTEFPSLASVAMIVADRQTGDVLAHIGSPGLGHTQRSGFLDMTRAVRSPGSTLKPLIFGLAFEQGLAHPETLIDDRPTQFGTYTPVNFDGRYHGKLSVRDALQRSLNIPTIALLDGVGPALLMNRMRRIGVGPILPPGRVPGLAIGLGGVGLTLADLMQIYVGIANQGTAPHLRYRLTDPVGSKPLLSPAAAWQISDVLAGTPAPQSAQNGKIAYKTGTSYGHRDAWSIGFDGQHVVGVWIGRPDAAPIPGITGRKTAAPLLFEAFSRLKPRVAPLASPPRDALVVSHADLPQPLKQYRGRGQSTVQDGPEILFPPHGASIDLARGEPLALKLRNGRPPFTWLINGIPVERRVLEREALWQPDGPGYLSISVVDRFGHSAQSRVRIE